jgi:hypothetical protein
MLQKNILKFYIFEIARYNENLIVTIPKKIK